MWIHLEFDLTAVLLPLATGASAVTFGMTALVALLVAAASRQPRRALRVAAWSAGLAALCTVPTVVMVFVDLPWPDDDLVHTLLWAWLVLFLGGLGLVAWQGWPRP